jgi:hypothetical protein
LHPAGASDTVTAQPPSSDNPRMRASVTLQVGAGKGGFDDTSIVIYV